MQKQHAAAAEVYAATRIAHGAVSQLFGGRSMPDLINCSDEDARAFLNEYGVSRRRQEELISEWLADKLRGAMMITDYLIELDIPLAETRQQEAKNLMLLNEIYFSDATIRSFHHYLTVSNKWIRRRKFPPQPGERLDPVDHSMLDESLAGVRNAFRAELGDVRDTPLVDSPDPTETGNAAGREINDA